MIVQALRAACRFGWFALLFAPLLAHAQPAKSTESTSTATVASIAKTARESLVAFNVADRDGRQRGMGTGFVISDDGLVATNLHVIGEGRPFTVELANGKEARVVEVYAADRHLDLALVRIEAPGETFKPLQVAGDETLADGAPVVVMGNPYGLKYSVVSGVLSGRREVDGRSMLQLAVPIEPGNSGGPVLDLEGRVHGVVTMKSAVTENLGFAVPSTHLTTLRDKPNPVPIDRWVRLGALDPRQWTTRFGANWRQRSGRIMVEGAGEGFGGRALCLAAGDAPEMPFELAVDVRLEDESGAAGLVFHSDGEDRHYGFYPSNGRLRLTCFDGASVFEWRILRDEPSPHYRPGKWNRLRVRLEAGRIQCFVNDEQVFDVRDSTFTSGQVGLAKFRDTQAEFRRFAVGASLAPSASLTDANREAIDALLASLEPLEKQNPEELAPLVAQGPAASERLLDRAEQLEREAELLRKTATDVRLQITLSELETHLDQPEPDLARSALLLAKLDDHELDVDAYIHEIDRMAAEIRSDLSEDADAAARMAALNRYLFEQNGYHGSRHEYYHRANSYLNRVLDDREGIPITLSVLYIELARRLELAVEGVGMPGHFIVRWRHGDDEEQLIDVFDGAKSLTREDAERLVRDYLDEPLSDEHLAAVSHRQIMERMLNNLIGIAQREGDREALRRYLEAMVVVMPDAFQYRGMRALVRFDTGRRTAAVADLDWFLEHEPPGIDLERIRAMRTQMMNAQ